MGHNRFLITGGQGCIGTWVVKNLVGTGFPTLVYDVEPEPRRMALVMHPEETAKVAFVQGDITDGECLTRTIKDYGVTHIIHLAALQFPACHANPVLGAQANVIGTLNIFEAVKRCRNEVRQIVYASSSAALGPEEAYEILPVPDDAPLFPASHYGVFKQCNEGNARAYWLNDGISSIGLRPGVVYGPGRDQGLSSALTEAIKAALLGRRFNIGFGGRLNAQYVDDVATSFIACATAEHVGASTFNQRGLVVSVSEFVAELERQIPSAQGLITHGQNQISAPAEVDDKGLRELVGQVVPTPLTDGIDKTVEIFRRLNAEGRLDVGPLSA